MSPVNEASGDGLPVLWVKDIPPQTDTDLKITRPADLLRRAGQRLRHRQEHEPRVRLRPGRSERRPPPTPGDGGVPIGSWIRRLAFSFRFKTAKILFSSSLTKDSRIMYLRTIKERVQALAPFLTYDKDPYLVLRDDGSLVWMWDAYTTTDRFPYSQKTRQGPQLHPQPHQGRHQRLRRQGDLLPDRRQGPAGQRLGRGVPRPVHPGRPDARRPAQPHALPGGLLQRPGRHAGDLPHDRPRDLLQQGGRVGDPH